MNIASVPRWQQAQEAERAWWMDPKHKAQRWADRFEDAAWYAGLLNISARDADETLHVLDIGGGPFPIAKALSLPLRHLTVLDPNDYGADANTFERTTRIFEPAEWFVPSIEYDEAWGYNVLQHVIDPEAVIATAKKAARVVRWLDWVNTPIHTIHPHSISANWLRNQFKGWRILFDTEGIVKRPEWSHEFIALVAARP